MNSSPPAGRVESSGPVASWWLLGPGLLWMGLLFVVPLSLVLVISFAERGTYGGIVWTFSLTNYLDLLHPLYARIFGQSILLAAVTTLLCLIMGFPLAYYIARAAPGRQGILLLLVMIPFWTNFLVRTYAWMFILRTEGLLNTLLLKLGVIAAPIELLYSNTAVVIGLVYSYLPFMVLPLYVALERVDRTLVEAAWDLYATRWVILWRIIVPLARPGIMAGCLLVFIPSLGAFLTPDLLGGARSMMVGNLIQHEFLVARDWPLGAAISCLLMLFVMGMMRWLLHASSSRSRQEEES
ncbi:MAG: ABC transporter permease [Nitrospirota bacterium]|nr:ABC transporter permease [Nitrospirota bacterium]